MFKKAVRHTGKIHTPRQHHRHQTLPAPSMISRAVIFLCITAGTAAFLPASSAFAQQTPSVTFSYTIPAGTLDQVLNQFASQTGILLSANGSLTRGHHSTGLHGRYTAAAGLHEILKNTGIEAVQQGERGYKLQALSSIESALPEVSVHAQSDNNGTTEGTNSYTATGASRTAAGLALTLRETPQSVTVVTQQHIDDFKLATLKDVLAHTPGVSIKTQGDNVTLFARGAAIQNFQTDGAREGVGSASALFNHNLIHDDMVTIDRVEVLKGSAGILQGDGYPTATVNMIRKKPTKEFQANVSASAGSWQNYQTSADVSGPLDASGNIRGRAIIALKDANTFKDKVHNRNIALYGTVDIDLTPATTLNIGLDYRQRKNRGGETMMGARGYDASGNIQPVVSRSWSGGADWTAYTQDVITAFGSLEHHFGNDWHLAFKANHKHAKTPDWRVASLASPGFLANVNDYNIDDTSQNASLDLSGSFHVFGRRHDLLLGYNYSHITSDVTYASANTAFWNAAGAWSNDHYYTGGTGMPEPTESEWQTNSVIRNATTIRRGAYLTARLNLTDNLKVIAGSRFSDYLYSLKGSRISQTTQKGVVTPYAGIVYDISQAFSLYASYANVFQPVTVRDVTGKTLNPEEGITYEIGSKATFFDHRLNVSAAYFWKRWENTYEATSEFVTGSATERAYRNINGVMEQGYEIEVSGQLRPHWQVQGSYVMNGKSIKNSSESPKQQFKLYTTYAFDHQLQGLTLGGGARWQSDIQAGPLVQQAYWLADVMARYRISKQLSVNLNINNLFDKRYYSGVLDASYGTQYGYYYSWGEPRNVTLSMRYDF